MWQITTVILLGTILQAHSTIWSCSQDSDCSFTTGAVCRTGSCACPSGQQLVLGGTRCANWSPYFTNQCVEDFQCSRLVTNFQCRRNEEAENGQCVCLEGSHYLFGRCWSSSDYAQPCVRDEDCFGALRDPFSLACVNQICDCAPGYYRRQRGECRKTATAVGERCVLDADCHLPNENGACDLLTFTCYERSSGESQRNSSLLKQIITKATSIQNNKATVQLNSTRSPTVGVATRQHGALCGVDNACASPFVCSSFGMCSCPPGYYSIDGGNTCYAELGSPSTQGQCIGLLAEVIDGICTCPNNFYYDLNMRDCVKVVRRLSDFCLTDESCRTFGSAVRCGEPTGDWDLRACECILEFAVWDPERNMCRLFAGIGEACQESSDCLAGNLEIECVFPGDGGSGSGDGSGEDTGDNSDEVSTGICTCPEGTTAQDGLCLSAGLDIGDSCQVSQECTATEHIGCYDGLCACSSAYVQVDGYCAPSLGGICAENADCFVQENLICSNNTDSPTCQCDSAFIQYNNTCWEPVSDAESTCNVTVQCTAMMGELSTCEDEKCVCAEGAHLRDERCWPQTGLFASCSTTSQCFLGNISQAVVCRNSICQCTFESPYDEELNTCIFTYSAATTTTGSFFTLLLTLYLVLSH